VSPRSSKSATRKGCWPLGVARILPGTAPQIRAAPVRPSCLTGILLVQGDGLFLTDETAKVKVELRDSLFETFAGKRVQVTGSPLAGDKPTSDAVQAIQVAQVAALAAAAAGGTTAGSRSP